jgi:hypothetical protein
LNSYCFLSFVCECFLQAISFVLSIVPGDLRAGNEVSITSAHTGGGNISLQSVRRPEIRENFRRSQSPHFA